MSDAAESRALSVFRQTVMEYVDVTDQIDKVMQQLKDVKRKRAELGATILEWMRKNGYNECALGDNGKLVRRESKRTEGLKADHIMAELRRVVGDEARADEVMHTINSRREVIVKESLSRRRPRATTVDDAAGNGAVNIE